MRGASERLLQLISADFEFSRGWPLPAGATIMRGGINFAIYSKNATDVTLVLFAPGEAESIAEFPLDPRFNRTGDIWHCFVKGLNPGVHYGYRMTRAPNLNPARHRFDSSRLLLDPHAKAVAGRESWGSRPPDGDGVRRSVIVADDFDWEFDQPLNIPLSDSIIYELHVRGFTRHPSSSAQKPGTFLGLTEKIPYLKELGVTAVELLPVNEFEEADTSRVNPLTGEFLLNYWGYQPIAFFAPKASYAWEPGEQVREFKEMVKRFHAAGIEVILDVVFNHTAEGDERGPVFSFRGIDNAVYYMLDPHGVRYMNYSGCGNTFNCNHPIVRQFIVDCLRYWVMEMHVDGFRFDLASILGRGQNGEVLANPPLLEHLAHDPVLAHTKLIAEAWDAAGLYQVGTFPAWGRWAEWNGKFRDDVRRFIKGDEGMAPAMATRLAGSPDLYQTSGRQPYHSINFITCHDGQTLLDLVSYQNKHNLANGEDNRDGHNADFGWNCGEEGPTRSPEVQATRMRQVRNLATILMLSSGVPMILAGDEFGRTQRGNNNAYCQDNEISWIDWRLAASNWGLLRFFRLLIAFRRRHPMLRRPSFLSDGRSGPHVDWHGIHLHQPDWSPSSRALAMHLWIRNESSGTDHIYLILNSYWEPLAFELPSLSRRKWFRFADTTLPAPDDITEVGREVLLANQRRYTAGPRSAVVLVNRRV